MKKQIDSERMAALDRLKQNYAIYEQNYSDYEADTKRETDPKGYGEMLYQSNKDFFARNQSSYELLTCLQKCARD